VARLLSVYLTRFGTSALALSSVGDPSGGPRYRPWIESNSVGTELLFFGEKDRSVLDAM